MDNFQNKNSIWDINELPEAKQVLVRQAREAIEAGRDPNVVAKMLSVHGIDSGYLRLNNEPGYKKVDFIASGQNFLKCAFGVASESVSKLKIIIKKTILVSCIWFFENALKFVEFVEFYRKKSITSKNLKSRNRLKKWFLTIEVIILLLFIWQIFFHN